MRNFPFIARMIVRLASMQASTPKQNYIPADTGTGARGVETVNSVMVKDRTNGIETIIEEDGHYHVVMEAPRNSMTTSGKFFFDASKGLPPYVVATFPTWIEYWMRMSGHKNVLGFNAPPCTCDFPQPFDKIDDRWLDW